jgi:hypothetical protein
MGKTHNDKSSLNRGATPTFFMRDSPSGNSAKRANRLGSNVALPRLWIGSGAAIGIESYA